MDWLGHNPTLDFPMCEVVQELPMDHPGLVSQGSPLQQMKVLFGDYKIFIKVLCAFLYEHVCM